MVGQVCEPDRLVPKLRNAHLKMNLTLPPNFPEKYIPAIIKAMNLCYVKKHLHEPPEFETVTKHAQ